jgi:hypothetical protein
VGTLGAGAAGRGGAVGGAVAAAGAMRLGGRGGVDEAGAGAGRDGRATEGCSLAGRLVMSRVPVRGEGSGRRAVPSGSPDAGDG